MGYCGPSGCIDNCPWPWRRYGGKGPKMLPSRLPYVIVPLGEKIGGDCDCDCGSSRLVLVGVFMYGAVDSRW